MGDGTAAGGGDKWLGEIAFNLTDPHKSKTELGVPVEHLGTRVQDLSLHSWFNPQTKKP